MMRKAFAQWPVAASGSFLIGDRQSDLEAARAAGLPAHHFTGGNLERFVERIIRAQL
jgi:D-glycero-D-manno-heptose 1,7-bisphosphate phosphatase